MIVVGSFAFVAEEYPINKNEISLPILQSLAALDWEDTDSTLAMCN